MTKHNFLILYQKSARRDDPHEMRIQGVVFDYESDNQSYHQKFIRDWRMLNKVDRKTLGHKNSTPLDPYLKWVRTRAQSLMMPYPSILPVIIEPVMEGEVLYIILHPDMPTSLEDLQRDWIKLKGGARYFRSPILREREEGFRTH